MNISHIYHTSKSARTLQRLRRLAHKCGEGEAELQTASLEDLRNRIEKLRNPAKASDAWHVSVFALVREISRRSLGLRQHDVQLIGGLVLAEGKLAEMRTGEGKTLTIAAPAIAAALQGYPVHVVTVNEYLAERDAESLRALYEACGLTVSVIKSGQLREEKQAAYACDIVYGVNHEFGFDYLRDNQALHLSHKVQRGLGYAIVDEVDSILIDEARTPLILSGSAPQSVPFEQVLDRAVRQLHIRDHFTVDEKQRAATFTDAGYARLEELLVADGIVSQTKALYQPENLMLVQRAGQTLLAHTVYQKDKHYVVRDGEIVIVDESTGRLMAGRRWGEGLHEAVEAKEQVAVKAPTLTQATITYQNFFKLYRKLAGLTGTAMTEAEEFTEIYQLQTVVVPTHKAPARRDLADVVFQTRQGKFAAIVAEIQTRHGKGQPVLVGTASVGDSEYLAHLLHKAGVAHSVLNARQNAQEAEIIARAGLPGAVTVATNMAGRGTDIVLGGHREPGQLEEDYQAIRQAVIASGGLHVLGAERHENRRVDNQLRGRAGRQGDVGSSQFFISLEDSLLRVFAADRGTALSRLVPDNSGVINPLVNKVVTLAQTRLERQGFQARLDLMKYDHVLAGQRLAIYGLRDELLGAEKPALLEQLDHLAAVAADLVAVEWLEGDWLPEDFDALALKQALKESFGVSLPVVGWVHQEELEPAQLRDRIREQVQAQMHAWADELDVDSLRAGLLSSLDQQWVEHLTNLDELRAGISLRSIAQQNPVFAFTKEASRLFEALTRAWAQQAIEQLKDHATFEQASQGDQTAQAALTPDQQVQLAHFRRLVTRNEPCPCGSGQRYKHCHGRL